MRFTCLKKAIMLGCFVILILSGSKQAFAEEAALIAAKQYILAIDEDATTEDLSRYWYSKIQNHWQENPKILQDELELAVKTHKIVLADGCLSSSPHKFEIPTTGSISYTYTLNTPFPATEVYPGGFTHDVTEYQITMNNEDGIWKVSGEGFVGILE